MIIDVTFELAPVVAAVFCDYTFRLIPIAAPAPRPIKRDWALVALAARAFLDSGTPADVLS